MDDQSLLDSARAGFMEEARDMLRQFEESVLALESRPQDAETLNAAFRAAHTIKGSSGLFGYDAIVRFTHELEAVLDAMRTARLAVTEEAIGLLLRGGDRVAKLLERAQAGDLSASEEDTELAATLRELLLRSGAGPAATHAQASQVERSGAPADAGAAGEVDWQLTVRFGAGALRNGFDPASFIRYLPRVGTVRRIATAIEQIPPLETLDPEDCHLSFDIELRSAEPRKTIEDVFEFARDDCVLELFGPGGSEPSAVQAEMKAGSPAGPQAGPQSATAAAAGGAERRLNPGGRRVEDARFIRVPADKLDQLIDLIGELVIAGSAAQLIARQEGSSRFSEAAQRIAQLIEGARDGALRLRMVPIGETFARFQRLVRDTAKALGKDIELTITGGDTELDKSMVEMISDPLTHLVRNSIDHGIETPADRLDAGKPGQGRLGLNAYHDSGSIVIEVSDDGRGLHRDRILAKAIERGVVAPEQALSEDEIDQLIFAPGFSTAEQVTDISGRGVGMDVVKRNIEALRGSVQLASTPGRGTTVQIRLPLTLAIIDGFLVAVGRSHYVIPLETVVECLEGPAHAANPDNGVTGVIDLRGEVLPFLDVRRFFGLPESDSASARPSLVVVRYGALKIGLRVDRLLGEYQTVIKPLGGLFSALKGIAGSTILGSGEVALILDVPGLVGSARPRPAAANRK